MIKIGIIGLGYWGPNYLRVFSQLEQCRVSACADSNDKRVDLFKINHPQIHFYSDFKEMIRKEPLDGVVIATPTTTHHPVAREILKDHLHVLLEKPLALTSKESQELCEAAEKAKKILMVGHTFLYNQAVTWIKKFVTEGGAGKVYYIHAQRTNLGPIRQDVNALVDLSPHDISMLLYLLGKEPSKVSARGSAFLNSSREDVAFIDLEFPDGSMGHVHVSWLEPRKVRQLTVIGDKKMIHFDDVNISEPVRIFDKGVTMSKEYASFGEFQMILRDGDIVIPKISLSEPLKNQCQAFLESINTGKTPLSDGRFGLKVVKVLEAAMESLKSDGRTVKI